MRENGIGYGRERERERERDNKGGSEMRQERTSEREK